MSSLGGQHPDEGVLLRYLDGELKGRQTRQVRAHLEACWQCRAATGELQGTVAECVRYRRNVLEAHLPPAPHPWPDLYREFDRIDAAEAGRSWAARMLGVLRAPTLRPWAVGAAAAAVLVFAIVYQFRQTPAVQAATLLKRAVAAADARPANPARRIQLRTPRHTIRRTVGRPAQPLDPAAEALAAKFRAARYDWDDPLSARAFQDWRDSLGNRRDEVAAVPEGYRIQTVADRGELESASLTLREVDLEPVEAHLEFRDHESVDVTELPDTSTPDGVPPAVTTIEPPVRHAEPSRPAAPLSGAPAPVSEELQVVAALHEIGADLGDPLEIKVSGGRVLVSGVGIPAQRQRQIREALGRIPDVTVDFNEPAAAAEPPQPAEPDIAAGGGPTPAVQTRIEKQLGGHAAFERFSNRLLDRKEAMLAQAYALADLARRFPAGAEASLDARGRGVLNGMALDYAAAIAREAAEIQRVVEPVLPRAAPPPAPGPEPSWQAEAAAVLQSANRVDQLLTATLGVSADAAAGGERASGELLPALSGLRARLDQLQKVMPR